MPAWIMSSSSTLAGNFAISCKARRRTSGAYCASVSDLSIFP
jgi:hypothetical protein